VVGDASAAKLSSVFGYPYGRSRFSSSLAASSDIDD